MSRLITARSSTSSLCLAILFAVCTRCLAGPSSDAPTPPAGCEQCPLAATSPVCDLDDGTQFPNECVARCQGVQRLGACPTPDEDLSATVNGAPGQGGSSAAAAHGQFMPESRRVVDGHVTWEVMNRMADKGFRFLGQFQYAESVPRALLEEGVLRADDSTIAPKGAANKAAAGAAAAALGQGGSPAELNRVLHVEGPAGYVYVSVDVVKPSPHTSSKPSHPAGGRALLSDSSNRSNRRLLNVIGTDERQFRSGQGSYPARAIVWLRYQQADGSWYSCSGSVISPSVILTAGHCVHDLTQGWYKNFVVYLGATKEDGYATRATHRGEAVTVRSMTALTGWTKKEKRSYDVAVLYLNQRLGDSVGWLGTKKDDCNSLFSIQGLQSWGFPADKRAGTQWGMRCSVKRVDQGTSCGTPGVMKHDCDTYPGQSGSAMYDSALYVHAVHAASKEGDFNSAPWLGGSIWDLVNGAVDSTQ